MWAPEDVTLLGLHFLLDGLVRDAERLADAALGRRALLELPDHLGLTRVGDPQIVTTEEGWVGMVLLAESHLSLHVRPTARLLHADLFSCRPFDVSVAEAWLKAHFGLERLHARTIER
jgi:S-adenosylmethionine decarboxylase